MRLRDLVGLTAAFTACGLVLAAAPRRSPYVMQEPATPPPLIEPAIPASVAAPAVPFPPAEPQVPRPPAAPAVPAAPSFLISAVDWSGHSGTRSRHDRPAGDCSDLDMRFEDQPATSESEQRTFARAEVSVLRVDELADGGVQLQGWDQDIYSVTACKGADASRADAKRLLSQIQLSVQSGHVSVTGPARHHDWNVYLLIRTPRAAEIELLARNGPVSFYGVDGKITARASNGPITVEDCTGEADIEAENGPISVSGSGGKLRLHTRNGPLSVALLGANWNGSLVADAVNGPLSLSVPSAFQSSFLVESRGHSPMSCHASICGQAHKTWDDEHRRIEYGEGPPVIRLSTENGPVSVNTR